MIKNHEPEARVLIGPLMENNACIMGDYFASRELFFGMVLGILPSRSFLLRQ